MVKSVKVSKPNFFEKLTEYEGTLKILYGVGIVILLILIYIVFFRSTSETPISTMNPNVTPGPTLLPAKIQNLKELVKKEMNKSEVLTTIKGKLEDWGNNVDKLPDDLKEKAIKCYQNPDGCVF
jgi:hypothetical protein